MNIYLYLNFNCLIKLYIIRINKWKYHHYPSSVSQPLKNDFYILLNLGEGLDKFGFYLFNKFEINYLDKQNPKFYFLFNELFSIIGNLLACKDIFYYFLC